MKYFIDIAYDSVNKKGEELCGDIVEIVRNGSSIIVVLADGLGSGVKANILATLTSKIAATMLKEGLTIEETVDTIVNTLPVCNVRQLAYSTFTILKIEEDGRMYIVEFDNPPLVFIRDGKLHEIEKTPRFINDKVIYESNIKLEQDDLLVAFSDGVIHAGVGEILNLGWQWENVSKHLARVTKRAKSAKYISSDLVETCLNLYNYKPGDDTTVVAVKMRKPEIVDLFTGPPENKDKDSMIAKMLMNVKGKRVVCGGTAATIVAREFGVKIIVDVKTMNTKIPPTAYIKGIDLVTEGVLTIGRTVEIIREFSAENKNKSVSFDFRKNDGATQLAKLLVEDCTHLNLWVGKAINPAHKNPNLPIDLSIKLKIISELVELMKKIGKKVKLTYI
ncbi:MAG: serine/threonine protein phosphatase [Alkaliphilus sp.]|nr:SpoIIE family protein phosphatase [bacterium AH-315-E09]PHS35142.1 MAG: serine/threonine protein phosphatase [Alkaliphilus sp.]